MTRGRDAQTLWGMQERMTYSGDCRKSSAAGARGQAEEQQKEDKERSGHRSLELYQYHWAAAENF